MFVIGLTGGIASGKTTVSRLFEKYGVPVIDADTISHQLTQPNTSAYEKIVEHFGQSILHDDQTLNRKKLRRIIFQNKTQRKWLENLLHPLIRQTMRNEIKKLTVPYCICVIPLLAESHGIDFIDHVLLIETPLDLQIDRAKKRDATNTKAIQKIIDAQANQQTKRKIANDILVNDTDLKTLEDKVQQLHEQYMLLGTEIGGNPCR